jgi:hypothetical protein
MLNVGKLQQKFNLVGYVVESSFDVYGAYHKIAVTVEDYFDDRAIF